MANKSPKQAASVAGIAKSYDKAQLADAFIVGGGQMGDLVREMDWSKSALGPMDRWPSSLRTTLGILLNSSFPMFVWWGEDTLINIYNDAYREILGTKHPAALGQPAPEVWAEIWQEIGPLSDEVFATGESIYLKNLKLFVSRFGYEEEAYFTFSYSPIRDEKGAIAGLFCAVTETTEEVIYNQRLLESETRFRTLADSAPMYIAMADKSGNAVYFNKSWLEYTGKSLEGMLGLGWLSVLHPEDAPRFERDFKHAFKNHITINEEYRFRRADGEYRWMLAVGAPRYTPDGHFIGYFGTYTDFHERKQTEEALHDQIRLMQTITGNTTLGLLMMDDRQRCTYMNPIAEAMTGFTFSEMQEMNRPLHDIIHHTHPDGRPYPMSECPIDSALPKKARIPGQDTFVHKDGRFYPVAFTASPILRDGTPVGTVIEVRDMTEEIKKEAKIRERDELEEIALALRAQQTELIALNRAKDEFISLASHQLRTPATGVKQYLHMLLDGYAGELSPTQSQYVGRANESNERQLTIVNDLLKVAQLDAGKMSLRKTKLDLVDLARRVLDEQAANFAARQQKVTLTFHGKKLVASVDEGRMRMVFDNLIDNASKYTPVGKRISIDIAQARNGHLRLRFKDEGVGISADDQKRIFDKFIRVDNPLSNAVGGSGLGLYIIKKIIDLHNGSVEVASTPGKGSVFTLIIPVGD